MFDMLQVSRGVFYPMLYNSEHQLAEKTANHLSA